MVPLAMASLPTNGSAMVAACHQAAPTSLHPSEREATITLAAEREINFTFAQLEGELTQNQPGGRHAGAGCDEHMLNIGHRVD